MHTNSLSANLKSPTCVRYTLKNWLRKPHNAWIKTLPPRVTWIKDFSQSQPTADDHNIFCSMARTLKKRIWGYKPRYLVPNTAKNRKEKTSFYLCFYSFTHLLGTLNRHRNSWCTKPGSVPLISVSVHHFRRRKNRHPRNEVRRIRFRTNPGLI